MRSILVRGVIGLAVSFWLFNVLAVAAFAVPDRYSGAQSIIISFMVLFGGLLPIGVFWFLFRERLPPPAFRPPLNSSSARNPPADGELLLEAISDREMEVLALVAEGFSNKEIAQRLTVTVATVKTHTNNINRKLGTRTRTQALARARKLDIL